MLFSELNEENFLLFAIKNYENPSAVTKEDFDKDLNHFRYIKRLLKRYRSSGELKVHLLINHFIINQQWYLVDLPGYGYARASRSTKNIFQKFITAYFKQRKQLVCAFVLIDIRHEPQLIDLEFMQWLGENAIPFNIVFTKSDKLKPKAIKRNIENYSVVLKEQWEELPQYFITSSLNYDGKLELLTHIGQINASLTN